MLISEGYREQQAALHTDPDINYGTAGKAFSSMVVEMFLGEDLEDILDYGSGKGKMAKRLPALPIRNYDPAIPEYAALPEPADLVLCLDVLEHIEPEYLDNVLDHLREMTKKRALISVDMAPAEKTLPDGRNAHLTQQPVEWWLPKIMERFILKHFTVVNNDETFFVIVEPKVTQ